MELQENSVIIDNRLDRMLDPELAIHFTHAYCEAGQCEVTFNGQVFAMHSNYGTRGGLSLYINPVMRLTDDEQAICQRGFENVFYRM